MDFHPLSTKSEYLVIEFILNSTRGGGVGWGGHSQSKTELRLLPYKIISIVGVLPVPLDHRSVWGDTFGNVLNSGD